MPRLNVRPQHASVADSPRRACRPLAAVSGGKSGRLEGRKSKAEDGGEDDDDDEMFDGETNTHLGENMSALAIPGRVLTAPKDLIQGPLPTERMSVILNFGVIDILQEYNIVKHIEHSWKVRAVRLWRRRLRSADARSFSQTIVQRQHNISSVDPTTYAERFRAFMSGIFS